jgi:hypothetical protein
MSLLYANRSDMASLAQSLNLSAGSKAIVQWERVFKSKRKMKKYKIDQLSEENKTRLKEYLIKHAIDSDQPTIAGV